VNSGVFLSIALFLCRFSQFPEFCLDLLEGSHSIVRNFGPTPGAFPKQATYSHRP
jgi:hypothetical protein